MEVRSYLVFRLYGPMASWGEVAVGEVRPSESVPTRSALLGLLAAALGLRREDDEAHSELAESLRFAVLVEAPGVPLRDYHTVQRLPSRSGRKPQLRLEQLAADRHRLDTIQSYRDYVCDAVYTVAASSRGSLQWSLEDLAKALHRPVYALYLGRKSCPPSVPLDPRVIHSSDLRRSLQEIAGAATAGLGRLFREPYLVEWEEGVDLRTGGEGSLVHVKEQRDDPVSRPRRTFRRRRVYQSTIEAGEEVADVSEPHQPGT
jgi:CRISPR system Cascade subunit CasD